MPHALAVVAQLVATFSLLVVPALALFLLSSALRRTMSREAVREGAESAGGDKAK
jgi:hypothetical protein